MFISYLFRNILYRIKSILSLPPSPQIKLLIDSLKREVHILPDLPNSSSAAQQAWIQNREKIRKFLLHEDPRAFFTCDALIDTMIVSNAKYTSNELALLKQEPAWQFRWKSALEESHGLKPAPHPLFPLSSGNTIHHAFHIAVFEEKTRFMIQDAKVIVEFGGGYGNMCRLIHKLGFNGKYFIFDLPELSLLQQFYLKVNGLNVRTELDDGNGIFCLADIDQFLAFGGEMSIDVFLATWSLSETPLELREKFHSFIKKSSHCLFAYQEVFEDVNNLQYFAALSKASGFEGSDWEIPFLPSNRYLIMSK